MHWRRRLINDIKRKIIPILFKDIKCNNLYIDTKFEYLPDGIKGFCSCNDSRENDFEIVLDRNQCKEELIVNLCHELVHVMQECRGDVFDYSKPYHKQAHEIEAYAMQSKLANLFMEA